jgi:hypothetical protein
MVALLVNLANKTVENMEPKPWERNNTQIKKLKYTRRYVIKNNKFMAEFKTYSRIADIYYYSYYYFILLCW